MTKKYLLTGPSGTGKTTIANELSSRGYKTIELDNVPDLSAWTNLKTGQKAPHSPPFTKNWLDQHLWLWNAKVLEELLNNLSGDKVFLVGDSANSLDFFNRFDKVFALSIDKTAIIQRLRNRQPERSIDPERWSNKYPEIGVIVKWNNEFKDIYKQLGVVLIDGKLSINQIADKIEASIK